MDGLPGFPARSMSTDPRYADTVSHVTKRYFGADALFADLSLDDDSWMMRFVRSCWLSVLAAVLAAGAGLILPGRAAALYGGQGMDLERGAARERRYRPGTDSRRATSGWVRSMDLPGSTDCSFPFLTEATTPLLRSPAVVRLFEDSHGNFWIGTDTAGVLRGGRARLTL